MVNVGQLLETRYRRPNPLQNPAQAKLLDRAQAAIDACLTRPAQRVSITTNPSNFRIAVLAERLTMISVCNQQVPFLALCPSEANFPDKIDPRKELTFSFSAHVFTGREYEVMDKALPLLEERLGDTMCLFELGDEKLSWDKGMEPADEFYYRTFYHPIVLEEMARMDLPQGSLVVDPGCGTGNLLWEIGRRFPHLKRLGSDLIELAAVQAQILNPGVPIYVTDAQELSYVELGTVSLFICCGLINKSVVTKAEAKNILHQIIVRSQNYGLLAVTGKSPPHFKRDEMIELGFWPLLVTKWDRGGFIPFGVYLIPRKIDHGGGRFQIVPVFNELKEESE
ncbi:hypothetical protein A2311_06135 [candidate division WOR-1 bacterium RIFOXYB2_FULL_48_7]|uniref:Methyltransferase domain-containing protein n=1 Tax=candidate division WOR-1 bacterium RIFOXYB2_FULL_48_7 TaxID=1802583 RepID=A0A1F4TS85_UNCSA|nr:MAG: hypothetical protein A2311_06135 [candidate division WOR-1 bacterium RIFOXYB2_FULL_48_7]